VNTRSHPRNRPSSVRLPVGESRLPGGVRGFNRRLQASPSSYSEI